MTVYAGIVAGGTGTRMGKCIPKQYLNLSGEPIIIHTLRAFAPFVDKIILACPESFFEYTKKLISSCSDLTAVCVITGGETRMQSMARILDAISPSDDDIILTHDGVRPFVCERIIKENIDLAKTYGACGTFFPAVDTLCVSDDGCTLSSVPDRNTIFSVQTPQTFNVNALKSLFETHFGNAENFTDLCGFALNFGTDVRMVMGEKENIKITSPVDIAMAEAILKKGV